MHPSPSSRAFFLGLLLVAAVTLGGCAAPPAAPEPDEPAAPAPGVTSTPAPAAPDATTVTEAPDAAMSQDDRIAQAVNLWLNENSPALAGQVTVEVEATDAGFARARVTPGDPAAADPAIAFLQEQAGQWTVLGLGTGFAPDFYDAYSIPPSLHLAGTDAGSVAPPADLSSQCETLQGTMSTAFGASVEAQPSAVTDPLTGATSEGCRLQIEGTGEIFEDFLAVADALRAALVAQGWQEDERYLADGPTGTATAFRQGNLLALLEVGWQPAPDAGCPPDQPIATCELEPSQKLYTISLSVAEPTAGSGP